MADQDVAAANITFGASVGGLGVCGPREWSCTGASRGPRGNLGEPDGLKEVSTRVEGWMDIKSKVREWLQLAKALARQLVVWLVAAWLMKQGERWRREDKKMGEGERKRHGGQEGTSGLPSCQWKTHCR